MPRDWNFHRFPLSHVVRHFCRLGNQKHPGAVRGFGRIEHSGSCVLKNILIILGPNYPRAERNFLRFWAADSILKEACSWAGAGLRSFSGASERPAG